MTAKLDDIFECFSDRWRDPVAIKAVRSVEPFAGADRWLLSSLLQKAIRRGDTNTAYRAGYQLLAIDRTRLWRRLMVVALEDIGIGDIRAAALLIATATTPKLRRLIGDDASALQYVVEEACAAIKDRTGDHLGSIVGREPIPEAASAVLKSASRSALLAIVAASSIPLAQRVRAALIVAGRYDADPLKSSGSDIDAAFEIFRELAVPDILVSACSAYAARARDLLPIAVPLAWCAWNRAGASEQMIAHDIPQAELVGDLPDYAFDPLHTRLGKRAVELWLRSYPMKLPWTPRQVSAALWNAEAALCNRTLSWKLGDEMQERAYRADLQANGLPIDHHVELMNWIARERRALTTARRTVWESAVRVSGEAQEPLSQANLPLPVPEQRKRDV